MPQVAVTLNSSPGHAKDASAHAAASSGGTEHRVRAACPHDCPDTCAMLVEVREGVALKVTGNPDHPSTNGALCTKVSRYTERTYHPERLLTPLKRVGKKGEGKFERVTWEAALSDIAARLKVIDGRDPQAILPYSYAGTMGLVQGEAMAGRFFNRLGASLLDRTICSNAGGEAFTYTLGGKLGMHSTFFAESKLIVLWGSNSITSNLHLWPRVLAAKRAGAQLVCIDPRKTETAEKCHTHLQLLPGTDGALALALMHELVVNDWLDHDYISQHTIGWPALRERALQWPPERAAAVCGLPVEQIRELARAYGSLAKAGEPVAIRLNYGMQRTHGGGNAARLVACLPALVGAWRHRAGGVLLSSSGWYPARHADLQRPDLRASAGHPPPRTVNMVTIGRDLQKESSPEFGPKVEAVIVYNSNPLAVAPQSAEVAKAFAREDLFTVVLEHFQTDTVDYADYVLPATTQLEHWDVHLSYGHTDVVLNQPAVAPVGQAKSNAQIFRELAAYMGFDEPCFQDSDEALARTAFEGVVSFDDLLSKGFAPLPLTATQGDAPFASGDFRTPSGKCEMFSQRLAALGQDGLPDFVPPLESVASARVLAQRFPLAMISPPARNFLNSTFVNVTSLRAIEGEPVLEIHPADAAPRGIAHWQIVRVFNERGSHECRAVVGERARPGVVNGLGIWWRKLARDGKNVNELTSQYLTDIGRAPLFYDCLVEVKAA